MCTIIHNDAQVYEGSELRATLDNFLLERKKNINSSFKTPLACRATISDSEWPKLIKILEDLELSSIRIYNIFRLLGRYVPRYLRTVMRHAAFVVSKVS